MNEAYLSIARVIFLSALGVVSSISWATNDLSVSASVSVQKQVENISTDDGRKTGSDFSVNNATVTVTVESLDSSQADQERLRALMASKPKAYVDKVMNSETVAKLDIEDQQAEKQPEGFRSYFLENRFSARASETDGNETDKGSGWLLHGGYRQETLNHGEFDFQVSFLQNNRTQEDSQQSSERFTLRNLGFPVTSAISADTSVGDISSGLSDAFERTGRLTLGNSSVRGAGTRIYRKDDKLGFDLRAGHGQRQSSFTDERYNQLEGTLTWLGYSQRIADKAFIGFQFNQAHGIPNQTYVAAQPDAGLADVDSFAAALGYGHHLNKAGDKKARIVFVRSRTTIIEQEQGDAQGFFVDAGFRQGHYQHEFGFYKSSARLNFADFLLAEKGRGAHWRTDYNGIHLNMGGGLEYQQREPEALSGNTVSERMSVYANARYRLDRQRFVGGNLRISDFRFGVTDSDAPVKKNRSIYTNAYYQTYFDGWGSSRIIATVRHNEDLVSNGPAASGEEMQWEHNWITAKYTTMRPELTTTLGWARDHSEDELTTYPTAGLSARYWLNSDWNVGTNLRLTARDSNLSTSRGLSGSLTTEYNSGKGWQLGGALHMNKARVEVEGNGFVDAVISRSDDKSAYIYARWDGSKGKPFSLSGKTRAGSTGSGNLSGVVYFDLNRDGLQQLDEHGVPGVAVLLDGSYVSRTDRDGKFEFIRVATGERRLSLDMNTVPLPWGEGSEGNSFNIEIPLRGQVNKRIPIVRLGG